MRLFRTAAVTALTQGIWGHRNESLAPSTRALGPNRYLGAKDFMWMLGAAFVIHALIFTAMALWPREKVTNIPVRALTFKLGDSESVVMVAAPVAVTPAVAAPVMGATTDDSWQASDNQPAQKVPPPLKPIEKPKLKPKPIKQSQPVLPPPPAIASTPQQYVREVGAPQPSNGTTSQTPTNDASAQTIRAHYEQQISGWIQRHKFYPSNAEGREGRSVVRMRIDRAGYVRYFAIEQSSGITALDVAALDMIRRANPVPAVPENYPAGNLVEFLIPITFKAPQ